MELPSSQAKALIRTEVKRQGFSAITSKTVYYTVGMGTANKPDLIAPASIPPRVFTLLASLYRAGELEFHGNNKFKLDAITVETPSMGKEPIRFQLVPLEDEKDAGIYRELFTGGYGEGFKFDGFLAVQAPDDDNRLYGEIDCMTEKPVTVILESLSLQMAENLKAKEKAEAEEKERVTKILTQKPTPRNKQKKNLKKRR